jgi:hypothetical protein
MPRRKTEFQYRLSITSEVSERDQVIITWFVLETTQQFASFQYDLGVREETTGNTIRFQVTGLRPPPLSLPSNGPARFTRTHQGLRGTYDIVIEGLDHKVNTFTININEKKIMLLKPPSHPFVELLLESSPSQQRK